MCNLNEDGTFRSRGVTTDGIPGPSSRRFTLEEVIEETITSLQRSATAAIESAAAYSVDIQAWTKKRDDALASARATELAIASLRETYER